MRQNLMILARLGDQSTRPDLGPSSAGPQETSEGRPFMHSDVVCFVALNLILRFVRASVMRVPFVIHVLRVNFYPLHVRVPSPD